MDRLGESVLFALVCGRSEVQQSDFADRPRQQQYDLSGGTPKARFGDFGAQAKVTRSLIAQINPKCRILASETHPKPKKTKRHSRYSPGRPAPSQQDGLSRGTPKARFGDFGAQAKVTRSLIAQINPECRTLASETQPKPKN